MVYTGKPSRACATCKKRRIKCDEGRPSCGQCIKSKRECTGYKTEAELMFRDETRVTAQRATKRAKVIPASPSSPDSSGSSSSSASPAPSNNLLAWNIGASSYVANPSIASSEPFYITNEGRIWDANAPVRPMIDGNDSFSQTISMSNPLWYLTPAPASPQSALSINLHEQANAYFFNHFTLYGTSHSFHMYDILQELYRKAEPDDPIRATTDAVSMLTLSRKRGHDSAKPEAHRAYANAVRKVAAAVADSAKVHEDETLLSVIMLGFAETMDVTTASHPNFVPRFSRLKEDTGIVKFHHAWGAHAAGAQLIVKARGVEDMRRSKNSLQLANFVRLQVITRQMFIAQPVEDLEDFWDEFAEFSEGMPAYAGHVALATIGLRIPSLRHRGLIACRKPVYEGLETELVDLLGDVYALEDKLSEWASRIKARNTYHVAGYYVDPISTELHHERVWPGPVYNHDSLMIMNGLNLCRIYRLFNQMLIFNILERLVSPDVLKQDPRFLACRQTMETIVTDICGSVPYGMGYVQDIPLSPTPAESSLGTFVTPDLMSAFVRNHHEDERNNPSEPPSTGPRTHQAEPTGPAIGAWYLIWPLFVSYNMVLISDEQKTWIRGRMKYIGDNFGIAQAMMYQQTYRQGYNEYLPDLRRRFLPMDFAPPPWQPLKRSESRVGSESLGFEFDL